MTDYIEMAGVLQGCKDLLITAHHDPDADCVGAILGLWHLFAGEQHGWTMVLEDEIPPNLKYLPDCGRIVHPADIVVQPQAVLLVDCGEPDRVSRGWLDAYYNLPFYCIDHHVSNVFRGELALVERDASSTGEIVAAMGEAAQLPVNIQAASCLYCAIVSDTGCFRYENTTPRSLEIAAKMLRKGVDMELTRVHLFESRSPAGMIVLQAAFRNMQFAADGALCYTFVRHEEAAAVQAVAADYNSIANFTLMRSGVKIGLLFEEYDNDVKVSLRSRQGLRMDKLAHALGGGGHVRAAGCRIDGNLETVLPLVLEKALEMIMHGV